MEKTFNHRDLEIWQLGMDLVEHVYRLTLDFPADERFGLISQVRRASVSVPTNISEGWGRHSQANLANFVRIARGSLSELDTLAELARRLGFLSEESWKQLNSEMEVLGRKSYAFLKKVEATVVKETRSEYNLDRIDLETEKAIANLNP
jgi:four helix bundle protein